MTLWVYKGQLYRQVNFASEPETEDGKARVKLTQEDEYGIASQIEKEAEWVLKKDCQIVDFNDVLMWYTEYQNG